MKRKKEIKNAKKELEYAINFKYLGVVSVEMDPKNPKTKFDSMLLDVVSEGKIYQIAMFNRDNTKFRLLEDILIGKDAPYNVSESSYCSKLNEKDKPIGRKCEDDNKEIFWDLMNAVSTKRVDIPNCVESCNVLVELKDGKPKEDDPFTLDYLAKCNKRFVGLQIEYFNKEFEKKLNFKCLSPEF